jgi:hypothetical protein
VHALRVPYPRAERAARAAGGRGTPGSPLRTCCNELLVRRLNLARTPQPARALQLSLSAALLTVRVAHAATAVTVLGSRIDASAD